MGIAEERQGRTIPTRIRQFLSTVHTELLKDRRTPHQPDPERHPFRLDEPV